MVATVAGPASIIVKFMAGCLSPEGAVPSNIVEHKSPSDFRLDKHRKQLSATPTSVHGEDDTRCAVLRNNVCDKLCFADPCDKHLDNNLVFNF